MENYDKNIEEIDLKLEGILSKIGGALKGLSRGMLGNKYDAEDSGENVDALKKMKTALKKSGNKDALKYLRGTPQLYLIGGNEVDEVSDKLYPY